MKQGMFEITENRPLAEHIMLMRLIGDTSEITQPGQFVNIRINGFYLRRPISVCHRTDNELTIIYKVVGRGTAALRQCRRGELLDLLTGLGNGYDLSPAGDKPLLLGGGVGVPPMYWLAEKLIGEGKQVSAVLGFNRKEEVFFADEFRRLGVETYITTADGSFGRRGVVTDMLPQLDYSYCFCCGPEPMLKAVFAAISSSGQFSFEQRMGCGFGACMGCSCHTVSGNKRICREGPVLKKEEIIWEG